MVVAAREARSQEQRQFVHPQVLDGVVFERALNKVWAEPARRFPHFGLIEMP
jgi:hypothetical protein